MEKYQKWLDSASIDQETKQELQSISNDKNEIEDRFYKDLEFGTGGLRGVIGAGSNRMNRYTVGKATQGLANYIIKQGREAALKGVAIAYDSRRKSREFAIETALVLNANGIKAYIYNELQPTPVLSFTVRELGTIAGIVITASHNPPQYNGYKVYWQDGGQIPPERAEDIILEVNAVKTFEEIKKITLSDAKQSGLFNVIPEKVVDKYIQNVIGLSVNKDLIKKYGKDFKIIYTPLHGSGNIPVRTVLKELGFENVSVVPEQEKPDGDFPTVRYPNPEEKEAFTLAIQKAKQEGADIIIGTDPDCDRVGVVVKDDKGEYKVLTGNQTGALLVDYYLGALKQKNCLPQNGKIIKTIVTSELGRVIAKSYGIDTIDTLTGFKFIGQKIKEFEDNGDSIFLFGYEESYGYLAGDFVRDKDAVIASMLICEMALYYKTLGMNLYKALNKLWEKFGFYMESLKSISMEGKEGMEKIKQMMDSLRHCRPRQLANISIATIEDYLESKSFILNSVEEQPINLPKSNVLRYIFEDGSWFAIRPSGTEPKVKLYFSVIGISVEDADLRMNRLINAVMDMVNS